MTVAKRALNGAVAILIRHYGSPPRPVSRDPFHLVLYEQVAYLVPEATRRSAFRRLKAEVGLTPEAILAASPRTLEAIARAGGPIAPALRAARMRGSAELVVGEWDGDLRRALRLPLARARAALAAFPMIGKPGAERILAVTGAHAVFGIESNALRVLVRLGWGRALRQYAATYRSVQEAVEPELPSQPARLAEWAALLRIHGQQLCRRATPLCMRCPLAPRCAFARSSGATHA